ncbi:MAG: hypothetical protein ACTHKE_08335 [Sphingomicrobium sp.]
MNDLVRLLRESLLFILAYPVGSFLAGLLTVVWEGTSASNSVLTGVFNAAMTYAAVAWLPLIVIGFPAVFTLKTKRFSRLPATAILTVGGGAVGALLLKSTFGQNEGFGEFVRGGTFEGASVGLVLGLLLFPRHAAELA